MGFATIEIQPTVDTTATAAKDVVFNLTPINLPAKHCKLLSVFAYVGDQDGTTAPGIADGDSMVLLFFKDNSGGDLGTVNATANITPANFVSNKFLGACKLTDEADMAIDDVVDNLRFMVGHNIATAVTAAESTNLNIVLEGDMSTGVGNTCYVGGIDLGTLDFVATDDLRIVFHVEY